MNTNTFYLLALNRIEGIGSRSILKLLKRWPNLEDLFTLSCQDLQEAGLSEKMAFAITTFNRKGVEVDLQWEKNENHHILTWEQTDYPSLLKEIHDPPPILYAKGNLSCLQQPTFSMVGTRMPSVLGRETAWCFAKELALNKITIVSGLARGIDAYAHEGCLAANGATIAVMGTGIDHIYPYQNEPLARKIQENGLLMTEFPLKSRATAGHFPRRNRIISGLSLSTLVVEAAIRSGSLITARLALEQNRDVFAIPGSIHNPQARGCHYLLQQGAKLITSVNDILEDLKITRAVGTPANHLPLAGRDENLVKCVGFELTTIDQIMNQSGLTMERVLCGLAQLELSGWVKAVPGGYSRCLLGNDNAH